MLSIIPRKNNDREGEVSLERGSVRLRFESMGKREVIFFLMMANPCKLLDGTKNIPFKVWKNTHSPINLLESDFFLESDFYEKLIIFFNVW